jgi:membrane protein involved in colicin uptake
MTTADAAKPNAPAAAPRRAADDPQGAARAKKKPDAKNTDAKRAEAKRAEAKKSRDGAQSAGQSHGGAERPRRVTKNG